MQTAYFSPDTTTIIVVWMEFDDDTWRCDVHARTSMSCDRIACLRLRRLRSLTPPSSAFLSTSRWVAASARGFEVWHLPSGQLEGSRTSPHTGDAQAQPRSGLVAVSPDGTRLAFLPADCSDAYLYDVATLDAVGVVQLGDVLQSDREACSLSWGPISWLLSGSSMSAGLQATGRQHLVCRGAEAREPGCSGICMQPRSCFCGCGGKRIRWRHTAGI